MIFKSVQVPADFHEQLCHVQHCHVRLLPGSLTLGVEHLCKHFLQLLEHALLAFNEGILDKVDLPAPSLRGHGPSRL